MEQKYLIPPYDEEGNRLTKPQAIELLKANPEKYLVKPESEDSTPVPMPRYGGYGSTRTSTPVPMPRYGGDGSTRTSTPVPMPRYGDGTLENRGPVDSYGYPIDTSRPIIGDGSTEKNITIEVDGKHVVIPSIWEGQDYSENHQVAINKAKEQGLNTFPSFPTAEEAVAYSKQRSNDINNVRGKDLEAYRSTRRVPTPYQDTHSGDTTGHSTTQMTPLPDANPAIPNDFSGDMTGPSTTIGPREELRMVPATESLPDSSPAGLPPTSDKSLGGVPLQNMPYTAEMAEAAKNDPSFSAQNMPYTAEMAEAAKNDPSFSTQEMPFTPFPSSGDETPSEADLLKRIQEYFKQPKTVDNPRYVPDGSENTFEDPRYVPDGDTTVEPMLSIPEALLESTKTFENTTGTLGVHSDAASRKPLQNLGYGLNINDPTSRSIFRDIMGEAIEPYLSGQKTLTEPQAEMLTLGRLELAMQEVGRRVDNFDSLPRPWQMGLTDMSYNLGSTRLGAIPGFIRAINQRDQQGALEALTQSNYYKDSRKEGLGGLKDRVDRNIAWFMEEPLSYEVSEQAPPNFPAGSPYDSQGNFVGNPEDTLTEYKPGVYGTLAQEMGELFGNTYKSHHYVNEAMSLSDWTPIGDIILGAEGLGEMFSGNFTEGTNLIGLAVGGSLAPYPAQKVKRMYKDMQKKSQVKDENGELLKVYHGTNREVNEFQNKGYGIFFTESPKDAASFGRIHGEEGLNVGEFHLNIEDLYDFSDPNHTELARDWLEENVDDFFITDDPSTLMDALKRGEYSILEHPGFIEDVIQKNGFDGALVVEYPGAKPNYMVFDDSQALPTTFVNANKARVPDVPKTFNDASKDPEVAKIFHETLADVQRGLPERAMLAVQNIHSGTLSDTVEHVGDITHRIAQRPEFYRGGAGDIATSASKVTRFLKRLREPYGFAREHSENLASNARYRGISLEQHTAEVDAALLKYAEEHSKLPVYNRNQWLAREAAVSLGHKDWKRAEDMLSELQDTIDNGTYVKRNMDFTRNADGSLQQYAPDVLPSGKAAREVDVPDRVVNTPHIRQDQPHGEWLQYKRQSAIEDSQKYKKPMVGVSTAYTKKPVMLPIEELKKVEGFRGEARIPGEPQYESLSKKVAEEGFQDHSPILLGVAYDGRPYIIEGNTRVAVAAANDITHIPVEVRWYDGGELVESSFSPEKVEEMIAANKGFAKEKP